ASHLGNGSNGQFPAGTMRAGQG
ncbi:MAG: hypothetical protein QOG44_1786, partial [Acidimicrobiaceae bacterium]|nr:hypothetical protein [Acidimicrobiaceae bacterium]